VSKELRVIIVLKRSDSSGSFFEMIRKNKPTEVLLCPVEYGCSVIIKEIIDFCQHSANIACRQLKFNHEFNINAFKYRDDYIAFIAGLSSKKVSPKQDLVSYFKCPFLNFSTWWFSLISERSTFKTFSYSFFVRIITVLDFKHKLKVNKIWASHDLLMKILFSADKEGIVFVGRISQLRDILEKIKAFIIQVLKCFKFYLVLIKRTIDINIFHLKNKKNGDFFKSDLFFVTAFPHLDSEALEQGKFINKAYGVLPEPIQLDGRPGFSWIGMFVNVEPHTWSKGLKFLEKIRKTDASFELLEEYLSLSVIFRLVGLHLSMLWRFFKSYSKLSRLFSYQSKEHNISLDLWTIFRSDFISSIAGKTLLEGLSYYFLFSAVTSKMKKNSRIVHFCEMQAWEKALQIAAKQKLDHECIGLQHTILSPMLLSYFNHFSEIKGNDFISSKPLPDKLGCVGDITRRLFASDGWHQDNLFVSGAFRFHRLSLRKKTQEMNPNRDNAVVVAFGMSPAVNREMLYFMHEAFSKKECSFKVLLKSHPYQTIKKNIEELKLELDPAIFQITDQPLCDIVPKTKAMIVKGSSSIFEALIDNIPVIVPQLHETVDLCPLSGISNLPIYVNSPGELYETINDVIKDGYRSNDLRDSNLFVDEYLKTFQDKSQYYETILNVLKC
jgi:surface carbohydrate biosynthesis protein (TIGR04326 family)